MAENVKGQNPHDHEQGKPHTATGVRENVGQHASNSREGTDRLDEKSSGMSRRDKGTGLSTKDGLTGSDYDGQVTD